jgi:nucleoside-triphosphatase
VPHNLFLTGRPRGGKTTLICRVLEQLRSLRPAGFTTAEIRGRRGRVGFRAAALGGPAIVLAHVYRPGPHRVGAYGVDVDAFGLGRPPHTVSPWTIGTSRPGQASPPGQGERG